MIPTASGQGKILTGFPLPPETDLSGDDTAGVTPLPIPNREDKPRRADGTIRATVWESRSLPGINPKVPFSYEWGFLFFGG